MNKYILISVFAGFLNAATASAANITLEFTGTVTSSHTGLTTITEIQPGDPVSGSYTFDLTATDGTPLDPATGLYDAPLLTLTVNGFTYSAPDNNITILDNAVLSPSDPPFDGYEVVSPLRDVTGPSLSGLPPAQIDISIVDTDATVFSDDSLPSSLALAEFEIVTDEPTGTTGGRLIFQSLANGMTGEVRFSIDSMSIQDGGSAPRKIGLAIVGLTFDVGGKAKSGEPVIITASAVAPEGTTVYYRFDLVPNYGTPDYSGFVYTTIKDFSPTNSIAHTFTQPGAYIIVVYASDVQGFPEGIAPIMGGSIEVVE